MTCALDLSGVFLGKPPNNNNGNNSGFHSVQRVGRGFSDRVISRSPLGLLGPRRVTSAVHPAPLQPRNP